ncbi:MAG: hypothetical protein WBV82_16345 [Myxococcaceae bacterium]
MTVLLLLGLALDASARTQEGEENAPTPSQEEEQKQEQAKPEQPAQGDGAEKQYPVLTPGAFTPGRGFQLAKTEFGELNISLYLLARYLNQLPVDQNYVDHLGREHDINTRNDIQLHRLMMFVHGFVYSPKLRYTAIFWTTNSTAQVAIAGSIGYLFSDAFNLFVGYIGLPGTRSMQMVFPYFFATDRMMADEFFRPGFTGGVMATGKPFPRFQYSAMVGNNLSQLGINAAKLTRSLAVSASIAVLPTTGEFGPRGGFGDYEMHPAPATRFGASFTHSSENRFSQPSANAPDNTQVRLTDSLLLFEQGALAPGVTVTNTLFDMLAVDAGVKWRGFHLQGEYYRRWLSSFESDGPIPFSQLVDQGFYVQLGYMVLPQYLGLYVGTSFVLGELNDAREVLGGVNVYPFETRNFRLNGHLIHVDRSAVSSVFGYYSGGQTGTTLSLAADIFF